MPRYLALMEPQQHQVHLGVGVILVQPMTTDRHKAQPTQETQPKKGKPVEIPVPKRSTFDRLLSKAEKPPKRTEQP